MSQVNPQTEGGCFCGRVRYRFHGDVKAVANCHCSMCRRTSGAPFVSWLVVNAESFEFTAGQPAELRSSEHGLRHFCDQCGTPVTCVLEQHPDIVDVTLGSLDAPEQFSPGMEVYEDTRLPWVSPMPPPA